MKREKFFQRPTATAQHSTVIQQHKQYEQYWEMVGIKKNQVHALSTYNMKRRQEKKKKGLKSWQVHIKIMDVIKITASK